MLVLDIFLCSWNSVQIMRITYKEQREFQSTKQLGCISKQDYIKEGFMRKKGERERERENIRK